MLPEKKKIIKISVVLIRIEISDHFYFWCQNNLFSDVS